MDVPIESMRDEILQQPEALRQTLEREQDTAGRLAAAIRRREPALVVIAGRGSSDNAALYGRYLIEAVNRLPVSLAAPSLFTIYEAPPRLRDALVIGVSQSGESADVLEVLREARSQGALTVGITNEERSPLSEEVDFSLVGRGGRELSVPATKSYSAQLVLFALVACAWNGKDERFAALGEVPEMVARVLECEQGIREVAERYAAIQRCVVLGRGYNLSTALEIALKIKETSYVLAQPYSLADFLHGPVALIERGFPALLIGPSGRALPGLLDVAARLRQAGAELVAFTDDRDLLALAHSGVPLPRVATEELSPVAYTVAGQLFAYHLARSRNLDPSNPRGLMKVTITL